MVKQTREERGTITIAISIDNWRKLMKIKIEKAMKSHDKVLEYLFREIKK